MNFAIVVQKVALKETWDLLNIWEQDPEYIRVKFAECISGDEFDVNKALNLSIERCHKRYADGKCSLCGGFASECAPRHAEGRSCA